jgi:RNA polymerase sigma-70 factor (ECF subfamily)
MLLAIAKGILGGDDAEESSAEDAPLEERSDEDLMLLYAEGEAAAFEILVARHEKPVFNYILRSCGRRGIAEELLQEVFMRVIKSAPRYKQTAKFTTWLYTIARNICIDRARKDGRYTEMSLDRKVGGDEGDEGAAFVDLLVDEDADASHVHYDRALFRERLQEALAELPEEQREVFLLKIISGKKFREIAEIVDSPVPTCKSRMRYALKALRGHLADYRDYSFDEQEREEVTEPSSG